MDITKIKQEWSDDELTIEYNDISLKKETEEPKLTPITIKDLKARLNDKLANVSLQNRNVLDKIGIKYATPKIVQTFSLATKPSDNKTKPLIAHSIDLNNSDVIASSPKVKPRNANKNIVLSKHAKISKLPASFSSRISLNRLLKSSYGRPINTTPLSFDGAKFLRTQVHSNPFLQSLLKDIVSLNNKKDDEDEDAINREIAKLRSKNKLPSLNPEVPIKVEFDDSDYLEDSEDDGFSYCNSKSSENYGKDSGYDNESQNSESLEEDTRSEIHENSSEQELVAVEPEYVDLDNYFESNTNSNDKHKRADSDINPVSKKNEEAVSNEIPKLHQDNQFACSHCNRIFKTKKLFTLHAKNHKSCFKVALSQIHSKERSGPRTLTMAKPKQSWQKQKYKPAVLLSCNECGLTFISQFVLEHHYEQNHSIKQDSNRNNHRKIAKESSESESVEIIELDSD